MTFPKLIQNIDGVLRQAIGVLMVLATVVFLWGVIKYMTAAGNEEKLNEAKQFIIYGLIGLFLMVAVWGIVRAAYKTLFG